MKWAPFITAVFVSLLTLQNLSFAWWNTSWEYRAPITINGSATALADYQVSIILNSSNFNFSKANPQGNDTRFTWLNGTTEQPVPFWIENWSASGSSGNATLWVKVPSLPANATATIYLYYSNTFANSTSNGSATFDFFDDFVGQTAGTEPAGWTILTAGGSYVQIYDATTVIIYADGSNTAVLYKPFTYPVNYVYETRMNMPSQDTNGDPFVIEDSASGRRVSTWMERSGWYNGDGYLNIGSGGYTVGWDVWRNYKLVTQGNSSDVYIDGTFAFNMNIGGWDGSSSWSGPTNRILHHHLGYWTAGYYLLDYTRVRKYASIEPSILSVGAEEINDKIYSIKTYSSNGNHESYFSEWQNVTIEVNGSFSNTPIITITDSNNTVLISNAAMANISSVFYFNYTLNGSSGWYDIKINSKTFDKTFYQGTVWQSTWADANGNVFPFRIGLNLSSNSNRWFEPIDLNVPFYYGSNNNSVRVVQYNGSALLEVPSQIYDLNQSGGEVKSARLAFLSTIGNQNKTYYIYYAKAAHEKNYTSDLSASNTSTEYGVSNSDYSIQFSKSYGGLMKYAIDEYGTNATLAGTTPMEYYPQFEIGITTYAARTTSVAATEISGPIIYRINFSGSTNGDSSKPYQSTCTLYSKNNYFLCEKNQSTTGTQDWKNFYISGLISADGLYTNATYRNSSDDVATRGLSSGDNSNSDSLDENMKWIALYSTATGNAVAELFLNRSFTATNSPKTTIIDDADYDYFQYMLIGSTSISVATGSSYYLKTARIIYNGLNGYGPVDATYSQLLNPINTTLGTDETYDTANPIYSPTGNISTNDTQNITCYSFWADDSYLDYATINITGPGSSGNATVLYSNPSYSIRSGAAFTNESWVNITVSGANAGTINCSITAFDIAGKSNSTSISFTVSDTKAPNMSGMSNSPNTEAGLDPGTNITVTLNLTEYTAIDTAILYYRYNEAWNSTLMQNISQSFYTQTYRTNFTPDTEANYTYYVFANDTLGREANSSQVNISVYYDWTWTSTPADLGAVSGTLNTNITVGNITLNNTGDKALEFKLDSDWDTPAQVFFNDTAEGDGSFYVSLEPGTSVKIPLVITAKSVERAQGDPVTITIDATNASAAPSQNTATATIVSFASGPFMLVSIPDYNATVTHGDTSIMLKAKVQNKGNETATNTWLAFTLPSGWSITSGALNKSLGTLAVDAIAYNTIYASVSDSAPTGTQTILATAGNLQNKTGDSSVLVSVAAKPSTAPTCIDGIKNQDETGVDCGGSCGSCSSGGSTGGSSSGGSSGGAVLTTEQKDKLFQTEETYELVRGSGEKFALKLENPLDGDLEDVSVSVTGFLSQYLNVEPKNIKKIPLKGTSSVTVSIEAPKYFTGGKYTLEFTISGTVRKVASTGNITSTSITKMKETRQVTLLIYEIPTEEAAEYLNGSALFAQEIEGVVSSSEGVRQILSEAKDSFERKDYAAVKAAFESLKDMKEKISSATSILEDVRQKIDVASYNGIKTSTTSRLVLLAESALKRGDYESALKRAEDARITYALETTGKFNPVTFVRNNFPLVSAAAILLLVIAYVGFMSIRYNLVNKKLSSLKKEEDVLMGLIKEVQKECFEAGKMSMEEYFESLVQYEEKMSFVIKEIIKLESVKANMFRFFGKADTALHEEKKKLVDMIRKTQGMYMQSGKIETKVYDYRMKSYADRLAEIEEKLADIEARAAMKSAGLKMWGII